MNRKLRRNLIALAAAGVALALAGGTLARDDNPPGPRGGPGTNWENPPGPIGGPGTSPDRRYPWYNPPGPRGGPGHHRWYRYPHRPHYRWWDPDTNPPGPRGGPGTNWENPPGPRGGPGVSPNRRGW